MPNTSSAKKALRSSAKKREFNLIKLSKIKNARRLFNKALTEEKPNKEDLIKYISEYFSTLDKATKSNYIHKNKASRLKSRATKKLNSVVQNLTK
jgi:small subunit ribosomal protein S20